MWISKAFKPLIGVQGWVLLAPRPHSQRLMICSSLRLDWRDSPADVGRSVISPVMAGAMIEADLLIGRI